MQDLKICDAMCEQATLTGLGQSLVSLSLQLVKPIL